ncbi:phage integrase SAM-like domain-containing protein [Ruminiclostridium herbifermentans]|uniref:Phage integrase SAM-like domain-containing protein n=1 Tax=Ruminiclostridium herbifermentans TaxID=2488810 RepID=A0A4U7J8F4_9FIRM|nr:phage integrase SAM-like domain-containing protein [Ruminiclostridium herbifermentans]QNU65907.1 phage integrase SAM-like domain-containing protein [Ruminiclostridium herbifermentans]
MLKGKTYGKQAFRTQKSKEKSLGEVAEKYYNLCTIRGTSEITIKGYKYALKYFNEFNGDSPINSVTVNMYILYLKKNGFKDTTINSYIRKLSPIFNYGHSKGYLPKVEIIELKVQKTFKDIYTEQEMNLLLKPPKQKDFVSIRNWCIVWVFASTAIRRTELINLKVMNVDMVNRVIALNHTKNKKVYSSI